MEQALQSKVKSGLRWSFGGRGLKIGFDLLISLLLMRLIDPIYFGWFAMVAVVAGFLEMLRAWGTAASIVQQSEVTHEDVSTLFLFNAFTGFLAGGVLLLGHGVIMLFYGVPTLFFVIVCYALSLALSGCLTIPMAYWLRSFDYGRLFWVELVPGILAGMVALCFALADEPELALCARLLIPSAAALVGVFWVFRKHPLSFNMVCLKRHLQFGWPIAIDELLNYFVRNFDDMLIGYTLGPNALGQYNRAYGLLLFPLRNFSQIIAKAMFPVLGGLQKNKEEIRMIYFKMIRLIASILFPCLFGLYLFARPVVQVLLGEAWGDVISLIEIFALLGIVQSIGTLEGLFFQSLGAAKQQLYVGLLTKPVLVGAMIAGLVISGSAAGLATGYAVASTGVVLYGSGQILQLLQSDYATFFRQLWPPVALCCLIGPISCFVARWASPDGDLFQLLVVGLLGFGGMYLLGFRCLFPDFYKESALLHE